MDGLGRTPLHLAAENSDIDQLEELLRSGSYDVNGQDVRGQTPLHSLFDKEIIDDMTDLKRAMSMLLRNGADVNIKDRFQDTPLHAVFYSYDAFVPEIIRYLLSNSCPKFDIESQNNVGYTIFYRFMTGFRESLKEDDAFPQIVRDTESFINDFLDGKIVQTCPVRRLLNMKDIFGCSAFQLYINQVDSNEETIRKMIELGADVNTQSGVGVTPLMDVVLDRVAPVAEVLLHAGADVNVTDMFGQTALFRVLTKDCFGLLKQHGADFTVRDIFGRLPITDPYLYSPEDAPRSGVVISDVTSQRRPLFELFLENGVRIHERDMFGSSLLHYAAWYGAPKMAVALIEKGVPLSVVDNYGVSPAELAWKVGNYELSNFLSDKPNEAAFEDPVKRPYVSLLIYHEDVADIGDILHEVVDFQENPENLLRNLINSPRMGLVSREPEAVEVKNEIFKLMNTIARSIGSKDPTFRCTVFPTGSSEDGSKIGEADEFDFTFCLDYFSEECLPFQEDCILNSGFATLKLKSFQACKSHPLAKFVSDGYIIESYIVRDTFQDLFTYAVNDPGTWQGLSFYFDGLLNFPTDKPILNMEVHWCGPVMKNIIISIDVVPAVRFSNWLPREMEKLSLELPLQREASHFDCFLLFQPPEFRNRQRRKFLRISRFSAELQCLKSLPVEFLESYAAAKILICDRFCPRLLFSEKFDIEEIFSHSACSNHVSEEQSEQSDDDVSENEEMVDVNSNGSGCANSDDGESCSGMIKGTLLYKHGKFQDLSSCVIEVDQSLRCTRLFVPKETQQLQISDLSFFIENGELRARNCNAIRCVQKDTSQWIQFGPTSNVPEQETLNAVLEKSLSSQENQDLTLEKWLTRTLPLNKNDSDNDSEGSDMGVKDDSENSECSSEDYKTMGGEGTTAQDSEHVGLMGRFSKEPQVEDSTEHKEAKCMLLYSRSGGSNETSPTQEISGDHSVTHNGKGSWEGGEIIDGYDTISSYMLKTCLFYVANDLKDSRNTSCLQITIRLFEKLWVCANAEKLDSFFLPYLDVFTFANEHIKMIPADEVAERSKLQCWRIKLFCQVILGILRQNEESFTS